MYTELEFNALCKSNSLLFTKEEILGEIKDNISWAEENIKYKSRLLNSLNKLYEVVVDREIDTIVPNIENDVLRGYLFLIDDDYVCLAKAFIDEVKFCYDNDIHEIVPDYVSFEYNDEDIIWSSLFLNNEG